MSSAPHRGPPRAPAPSSPRHPTRRLTLVLGSTLTSWQVRAGARQAVAKQGGQTEVMASLGSTGAAGLVWAPHPFRSGCS